MMNIEDFLDLVRNRRSIRVYEPTPVSDEYIGKILEAARWAHYLRSGGIAIVNNQALPPLSVSLGSEHYPGDKEITDILRRRTEQIYWVNGTSRARELGNIRALNVFMLGCTSVFLPLKVTVWKEIISSHLPVSILKLNLTAFDRGRKEIRSVHLGKD